jgi:predicted outer membrane repeat protein
LGPWRASHSPGSRSFQNVLQAKNLLQLKFGGAIYTEQGSVAIAGPNRTEITGNRAKNGGAIYSKGGVVKIDANNYTISSNFPVRGGAIFNDGGKVITTRDTVLLAFQTAVLTQVGLLPAADVLPGRESNDDRQHW